MLICSVGLNSRKPHVRAAFGAPWVEDALGNDFISTHHISPHRPLPVGVPQRRFVEYDRARQEPLDSHQSLKHGVKLTEVLSQSLDTSGIRLGYSDNQGSECPHLGVERT